MFLNIDTKVKLSFYLQVIVSSVARLKYRPGVTRFTKFFLVLVSVCVNNVELRIATAQI